MLNAISSGCSLQGNSREQHVPSNPPSATRETVSSHGVVIDAQLLEQLHAENFQSLVRCLLFGTLYVACATAVVYLAADPQLSPLRVLARLPLYLVAAAALHGISLFTHEAVHSVLSRNHMLNRAFGMACALPVLQNFSAYKVLHLRHHKHLGDEGDPDHYDNYTRWTWLVFSMHWLRLIIGYPIYIVMIPILGFRQGTTSDRCWIFFEVVLLSLLVAFVAAAFSWQTLLHAWLIPMIIINTLVNIRGMSQHTFLEEPEDPVRGTRSILTNPITSFFMCNENYHLEHHLFPRVPWYNLRRLHMALKDQLVERKAPFVQSYFEFVREFVRKSWQRSPVGRRRKPL
jgi:fatty acid desaturase